MSSHRQMNKDSAKDLMLLFLVLALIIGAMLAFRKQFRDTEGDAQRDWYYQRVAPPKSGQAAPRVNR